MTNHTGGGPASDEIVPGQGLYGIDEFRRRASAQTGPYDTQEWGDHRLNVGFADKFFDRPMRKAAVLIALIDRGEEATVVLTRRTDELRTHSGQVALPGGRIDPGDDSPEAAALREAEEEIGLPRDRVEIVGRLPDYSTGSGFRIAPILGIVSEPPEFVPEPGEVADIFEVPLSFLMAEANHVQDSRDWQGIERHYWTIPYEDWHIWGVTAGVLRTMYERLYA